MSSQHWKRRLRATSGPSFFRRGDILVRPRGADALQSSRHSNPAPKSSLRKRSAAARERTWLRSSSSSTPTPWRPWPDRKSRPMGFVTSTSVQRPQAGSSPDLQNEGEPSSPPSAAPFRERESFMT